MPTSKKLMPPAFSQEISGPYGSVVWAKLGGQRGVYQLLFAEVAQKHRRSGHGSDLLVAAVAAMGKHGKVIGDPARRLIVLVRQPDVILRAWLQRGGFVHVHTLENVDETEDVMVLQRAFD